MPAGRFDYWLTNIAMGNAAVMVIGKPQVWKEVQSVPEHRSVKKWIDNGKWLHYYMVW